MWVGQLGSFMEGVLPGKQNGEGLCAYIKGKYIFGFAWNLPYPFPSHIWGRFTVYLLTQIGL